MGSSGMMGLPGFPGLKVNPTVWTWYIMRDLVASTNYDSNMSFIDSLS